MELLHFTDNNHNEATPANPHTIQAEQRFWKENKINKDAVSIERKMSRNIYSCG